MAAAEYFSNGSMNQVKPASSRPSTSQPQASTSSIYIHQPVPQQPHQRPPPYQEHVHFAPAAINIPQRHSFSHQQRPSQGPVSQIQQHNYSPYGNSPQQDPYYSINHAPNRFETPPQHPQHLTPHMRPYANPNSSQYSVGNNGYVSDPEQQRRRHKHQPRRHSGEDRSPKSSRSKSSSRSTHRDAFLGAAGGGLIGDLIFPGLGTVGGAALGWFGGKDYGRHRKGREGKRADDQLKWEKKYGSSDDQDRRRGSSDYR